MQRDLLLVERLNNKSSSLKTGCFPSSMVSGSGLVIVDTVDSSAYISVITQEVACSKSPVLSIMSNRTGISTFPGSSTVKQSDTSTRQHSCHAIKHMIQRPSRSMPNRMPIFHRICPYNAFHSHAPAYHIGQEVTA